MTKKYKSNPRKVKSLMMLQGIENRDIAALARVHPVYVSYVIHGRRLGTRIRAAIAQALGVKVSELWPDNSHKRAA